MSSPDKEHQKEHSSRTETFPLVAAEVIEQVNNLENDISELTLEALQQKTDDFRRRLAKRLLAAGENERERVQEEVLNQILPEAFAVVREASKRTLGQRHYDVQIMGGLALHQAMVAQMRTGEGKTLTATLPTYLNALALNPAWVDRAVQEWGDNPDDWEFRPIEEIPVGQGVHIVTTNDYLARRDARWMASIYETLGLSSGVLQNSTSANDTEPSFLVDLESSSETEVEDQLQAVSRKEAYQADITYGTNNEFGFDYLRDNMKMRLADRVQRGHNFAIIDEVDNILIDEARTPLIISGPSTEDVSLYPRVAEAIRQLTPDDYEVNSINRSVTLTSDGRTHLEKILGESLGDPYLPEQLTPSQMRLVGLINQALQAEFIYIKNKDYVLVTNSETGKKVVVIVDNFTGRLMPGRTWSDGIHQAVEAKEGLEEISGENATYAMISIQNYFQMYEKLSGMTGTGGEEEEEREFLDVYGMGIEEILSHLFYQASQAESDLVAAINNSEPGVEKIFYHRRDDENETPVAWERTDYPDVIYGSERAKIAAILKEIREYHQLGRPVLVGTTSVEQSQQLSASLTDISHHQVLNAEKHTEESQIIAGAGAFGAVTIATNMAGRGVDIKLGGEIPEEVVATVNQVLISQGVENPQELSLEEQRVEIGSLNSADYQGLQAEVAQFLQHLQDRERVRELGGLHVIGTERHEARRIDDQLRGRAARQDDPGSSRFILSMEDELIQRQVEHDSQLGEYLEELSLDDLQPLTDTQAQGFMDKAQARIEADNFDTRRHLLEFDEVLNTQRELVYALQERILSKADIGEDITEMTHNEVELRAEKMLSQPDGLESFLSWLEQVQPTLVFRQERWPSFGLGLLIEQVENMMVQDGSESREELIENLLYLRTKLIKAEEARLLKGTEVNINQVRTDKIKLIRSLLRSISKVAGYEPSLRAEELMFRDKKYFKKRVLDEIKEIYIFRQLVEFGDDDGPGTLEAELEPFLTELGEAELSFPDVVQLAEIVLLAGKDYLSVNHLEVAAESLAGLKTAEIGAEVMNRLDEADEFVALQWSQTEYGEESLVELQKQLLLRLIISFWMRQLTQLEEIRVGVGVESWGGADPLVMYKDKAVDLYQKMMAEIRFRAVNDFHKILPPQ